MQSTLGEFQETASQEAFALQNSKLLKVNLQQITIQAKLGSMVGYQGDVSFEHAGSGGMSRLVKKAVTGEGASLMKISGTGEVFLADQAQDIHLIKLENDQITCNGANLLAFDAGIDWDIKREKGVGAMAGGLFNMALSGHRLGRDHLRRPARAPADRRASPPTPTRGGDHLGVERPDVDQDRRQPEDAHRQGLRRDGADGLLGPGLGARAAERGPRAGRARGRRRRRAGGVLGNLTR